MNTHEQAEEKLLVGYRQLADFLTEAGFPISKSTVTKYCSPSINIGPPVESYWSKLPTFLPSRAIAWARARLKPVSTVRIEPNRRVRPHERTKAEGSA